MNRIKSLKVIGTSRWIAAALLLLAAVAVVYYDSSSYGFSSRPPALRQPLRSAAASDRAPLPAFRLADLDGRQRDITEWRGKVVVLSFWATWCEPCRRDLPVFKALQSEYGNEGLQFVGIALDGEAPVRRYVFLEGLNYPQLVDASRAPELERLLGNRLGVLPFTVVVDRQGRIAERVFGQWSHDEAVTSLKPLL